MGAFDTKAVQCALSISVEYRSKLPPHCTAPDVPENTGDDYGICDDYGIGDGDGIGDYYGIGDDYGIGYEYGIGDGYGINDDYGIGDGYGIGDEYGLGPSPCCMDSGQIRDIMNSGTRAGMDGGRFLGKGDDYGIGDMA